MNKINETYRIGKTEIHVPHLKGVSHEDFNKMFKHLEFNKDKAWKGVQEKLATLERVDELEKQPEAKKTDDAGKSTKAVSKDGGSQSASADEKTVR